MANTITKTTLLDSDKRLTVKIDITGDGTGEETATIAVDASTYSPVFIQSKIDKIWSSLSGFSVELLWDATANVVAYNLTTNVSEDIGFDEIGGLSNLAGAGITGDIVFSTIGLGAGDKGSIILHLRKKD